VNPLLDLQKQRDQFALAMRVRLGKDGFQLISRRLPGYLQLPGGDIGRSPRAMMQATFASDGVSRNVLARIAADGPGLGPKAFNVRRARASCAGGCDVPSHGSVNS